METSDQNNKVYIAIAKLLTTVNSVEFIINATIEMLISYFTSELNKNNRDSAIQFIEQESMTKRINLLLVFLCMVKGNDSEINDIIKRLTEFLKYYNSEIRDIRDFIAHNPYIQTQDKIIGSRQYRNKGAITSLTFENIESASESLIPQLKEIFNIAAILQSKFKAYPIRDISK